MIVTSRYLENMNNSQKKMGLFLYNSTTYKVFKHCTPMKTLPIMNLPAKLSNRIMVRLL